MDIFGRVGWEAIILPTTDLQLYFFTCRHLISSVWPVTSSSNLGGKFPHIPKHLTGPDTGAVQVGHCFIQIDTKMTNLEKQLDSHPRAKPLYITQQIWVRNAFIWMSTDGHTFSCVTWVCGVKHQPSNGDVAVSQAVQKPWDVIQNQILPQTTFFQELLRLCVRPFADSRVSACLWKEKKTWITFQRKRESLILKVNHTQKNPSTNNNISVWDK